jgi:hypothetical protein
MPGAGLRQSRAGDQIRHGGSQGLHGTEPGGGAMMPKRIQLRRVKGWRMPSNTVKVARGATIGCGQIQRWLAEGKNNGQSGFTWPGARGEGYSWPKGGVQRGFIGEMD